MKCKFANHRPRELMQTPRENSATRFFMSCRSPATLEMDDVHPKKLGHQRRRSSIEARWPTLVFIQTLARVHHTPGGALNLSLCFFHQSLAVRNLEDDFQAR